MTTLFEKAYQDGYRLAFEEQENGALFQSDDPFEEPDSLADYLFEITGEKIYDLPLDLVEELVAQYYEGYEDAWQEEKKDYCP